MNATVRTFAVLLVLPLLAAALPCAAQDALPANVRDVLKSAPRASAGVLHVETADLLKPLLDMLQSTEMLDANQARVLAAVGGKIKSIDVFVVPMFHQPAPVVVAHGKLTPADLESLAGLFEGAKLRELHPGRFGLMGRNVPPFGAVLGGMDPNLGEGLVVAGLAPTLTTALLKSLGQADPAVAARFLAGADTTQPIWGGMDLAAVLDPREMSDAPSRMVAWGNLLKKGGPATLRMIFSTEQAAAAMMKEINEEAQAGSEQALFFQSLLAFKQDANVVTASYKADDAPIEGLRRILLFARKEARRTMSMANLRSITVALLVYQSEHSQYPPGLQTLLDQDLIQPQMLLSPTSGKKVQRGADGKPLFRTDYVYLSYGAVSVEDDQSDLIVAYEPAELNEGKYVNAAFLDGHVERLTPDEFKAKLQQTIEWRSKHGLK